MSNSCAKLTNHPLIRCAELEQIILDCWYWLEPRPRAQSIWFSQQMRNDEIIENQEEIITALREILEPAVKRIRFDGDNGSCDDSGDIAETESTTEIETTEESEPTNGGTQDDQSA